jgi:acyl-CoA thioesterase-2
VLEEKMASKACSDIDVLVELLQLLNLEQMEENVFRGRSQDLGFGNVYGGQVLGQALSAAYKTVPPERRAHSLHAYFLRPGDVRDSIVYHVDRIRDGKSFTTRRVVAVQKERPIFNMSASFQIDEAGFEHQDQAPTVPGPEGLASEMEIVSRISDQLPARIRERLQCPQPIELRPVETMNLFSPEKREPVRHQWLKTIDILPEDPAIHQYLLAYASDYGFMTTALYPHGHGLLDPGMQVASLDHAMWFHRPFRMDDWLLYAVESPNASGARGLAIGRIFNRQGALVATVAQEGLIRFRAQNG